MVEIPKEQLYAQYSPFRLKVTYSLVSVLSNKKKANKKKRLYIEALARWTLGRKITVFIRDIITNFVGRSAILRASRVYWLIVKSYWK